MRIGDLETVAAPMPTLSNTRCAHPVGIYAPSRKLPESTTDPIELYVTLIGVFVCSTCSAVGPAPAKVVRRMSRDSCAGKRLARCIV